MKKNILGLCVILYVTLNACNAQEPPKKINWMSFEEAYNKKDKSKKIFIDMYTHWCGWCKRMDASTFQDDSIAKYMNEKYYAVKFDAETKDTLRFKDKDYMFRPEFKANELAASLMNGQMSYPTFVFLDENFNVITPLPGYQTTEQLMPVLKFVGDNIFKEKTWEDYTKEAVTQSK